MKNDPVYRARETLISEEKAIKSLKSLVFGPLKKALDIIINRKGRIVITGIGKSGFIGMKISATLTSLGHKAIFLHPVEAIHGDLGFVSPGDCVIALSFSGESPEVIKLVKYLKAGFEVQIISITKNKNTTLGKLSDFVIELPIKNEGSPHGIAPMASTTATLVLGDMIASALTSPRTFKKGHFAKFHPGGGLALTLRQVSEVMTRGNDVPLVKDNWTLPKALKEMSIKILGVTGVVNEKKELVGVITDGDIRRYLLSRVYNRDVLVKEVMTKKPKTIESSSTLKKALEMMEKYRITSLFVHSKNKKVKGILHIHDILEEAVL